LEAAGIAGFFLLAAVLFARVVGDVHPVAALAGVFVGLLGADLVSGIVHWVGDTWGTPDWPILGPSLIRPFREHHEDPQAIVRHDFVETNGNNSLGSLVLVLAGLATPLDGPVGDVVASTLLSLSVWLFATNQIHKWAHAAARPRSVRWLQDHRWILSPEHHALHHAQPFDRYYCITTGWLNPLLLRIGFFARLERWISALFGAVVRRAV
jgi:ubiquitin-conjugating enzyme E2 variant